MLSAADVDSIVKRAFADEPVELLDYQLGPYSSKQLGFMGNHQSLEVKLRRNESSSPESVQFFVKSLHVSSKTQSDFIRHRNIYSQEAEFFNQLLPEFERDYSGEAWAPRCYLANDKLIVLEDLRSRGFAMREDKIFQGDELKSAIKAQARMHACSLLAEARLGRTLEGAFPEACHEQIFNESLRLWLFIESSELLAKKHGRDHRRIQAGMRRGAERMAKSVGRGKLGRVVCHGDGWPNNVLFDKGLPASCVLIDYQLTRYAPRMFDVAQMIYLSTTREIRKREEREAIETYQQELCELLESNNPKLPRPSLEDLLEEYEDVRLSAMVLGIAYYPIIDITQDLFDAYKGNMEGLYKDIVFRKNNDYLMELYDSYPEYARRQAELVLELVDYCEEHDLPVEE